jgi:serine/threonine protein kinase
LERSSRRHLLNGQDVAIKVMAKPNFPSVKHLLYKEIEVMNKFNHQNMVRLLEVDCSVNCYLVMELAEGYLRDQLDKKERMSRQEATTCPRPSRPW